MQEQARLRSARFRAERENDWKRLEFIVNRAEKQGVRSLSFEDARDLATLYRQAANSLSVAREISLDKSLLTYLEALTARACLSVYAPQETLSGVVTRFLTVGAPQAMRRSFGHIFLAFLAMALGALAGGALFFESPEWYGVFMPGETDRRAVASIDRRRSARGNLSTGCRGAGSIGSVCILPLFAQHPHRNLCFCSRCLCRGDDVLAYILQRPDHRCVCGIAYRQGVGLGYLRLAFDPWRYRA